MATQQQTVLRVQTNIPGAISGSTTYEFLDLYGDIPIKINKSFAELQDISKRNSDYSIGLTLPGSKKNNRFFENFFNVDAQSLYFDATQRVPCNVLLNDESYFSGYLKLNKTSVKDSAVEYDVTLFSNIGDLFGKIGNNLLKDLDYDTDVIGYDYKFNHQFTKFQVSSWVDYNPYSYDYEPLFFYPIVHNGYNYSGETVLLSGTTTSAITSGVTRLYTTTITGSYPSNAAAYAAGVKRYRINSPEDGLIDNQLKPALSIRGLITLMFQTYGYTIKSDFFNTPWFRMLYMYGYFSSEATKFSYKVPPKSDAVSNDLAVKLTETFVDDTDPICNNIRTTRTYSIQLVNRDTGVQAYSETPLDIVLLFKYYPCGSTIGTDQNVTVTIPVNATGTTYTWISNQFVRCPSTCKLEYRQNFGVNDSLSDVPEYSDLPPNTIVIYEDNDLIEFDLVIDWNLKQIDILSSIAKKFNLVFIPDPDVPNQIIIEPYNYYIGTGNIHDWTPKISYDKGFTVEPALNYIESELILSDLEDGDYGNKTFKDRNNRLYGENKVYNPTAFKSQTKKIDTVFSPELVRQWDTIDTAPNANVKLPLGINYASSSSSQNSGGSESIVWTYPGVKTKPKLMYWTGNFNPFLDQVGEAITLTGGTVLTNVFYVAESDGDSPRQSFVAPIIGTTMPVGNPDGNKINNDSICNLFNSELPTDIGVTAFSAYTENDAYSIFYQNRVENLYDPNTRFLNGYFNLNYSDIKNLKPNDLIKINEQYFTWNKIDGFNLTNPELTKVELVQANNNPSVYPTRYFQYYYCDNPSTVFKFETDFTNPSLSGTSFGWSATYDYNVGLLGGNVSGYTSTMRDFVQSPNDTIPYYIYEVSESTYNTNGFDRSYDTMWTYLSNLNGDLNPSNFPTYAYGATKIVTNVFTDCANFNYYASTYTIPTGSSTYHGNPVSQTPTPTPTPTPTSNVAQLVRGSLLITYDEPNTNTSTTYVSVLVNGVNRQVTHNDITNLYSTYIYSGDVVNVKITTTASVNSLDITRRDYTTDAQGGDNGIRDTFITGTTGNSVGGFYQITFTVQPDSLDYNFEYLVDAYTASPTPTPTPTPTATPPSIAGNLQFAFAGTEPNENYIWRSLDYGQTWSGGYFSSDSLSRGTCSGTGQYVYASSGQKLFKSVNYGNSFDRILGMPWGDSYGSNDINEMASNYSGQKVFLQTFNSTLWLSNDYGVTYNVIDTYGVAPKGLAISQDGTKLVFIGSYGPFDGVGFTYKIYTSNDSGSTFDLKLTTPSGQTYGNIAMSYDGTYMTAVGTRFYNSNDGGNTWTYNSSASGSTQSGTQVSLSETGQYQLTNLEQKYIYKSSNYGVTWTLIPSPSSTINDCGGLFVSASGKYQTFEVNSAIYYSTDYGNNWTVSNVTGFSSNFLRIDGATTYVPVIPTPTPTPTSSVTPTVTPSVTPSLTPTLTPFLTPTPSITPNFTYPIIQSGLTINVNGTSGSYPGTGTTWYDLQTNYNGTLFNGPTWSSSTGGFFTFDGINDYCYFGDSSKGSNTVSKTFGGWVKTATSATNKVFFFRGLDGFDLGWSLSLSKNTSNRFVAGCINGIGYDYTITGTTTMTTNTWYYIVAKWISSTSLSIYVNGLLEGTISFTEPDLRNSTVGWQIARSNGPTYSSVSIGDFELYERALSNSEILQNFNTRKHYYGY